MEKKIFYTAAMLLLYCCGPVSLSAQYSGLVKYVGAPDKGTVTVESTGFAKKKPESDVNAGATALYTLLFRGLPGSVYDLPMIPDEQAKKDDPVVRALLQGGYGSFVTADVLERMEATKKKPDGMKGIVTIHTITFNYDALRRYLEAHSVIRKFGY
ncbi:MAG TPA: hypothetical protein VNS58_28955 [Puia sp.]|nr:hypothetical protein [Puia sp.]